MRTFSLSAGVTNGVQKAFNGLPPALNVALCSAEPYSTWLELPQRWSLPKETGFHFCAAPFQLKASSLTAFENNGLWSLHAYRTWFQLCSDLNTIDVSIRCTKWDSVWTLHPVFVLLIRISFMLKYPSIRWEGNEVFNPELRIIGLKVMTTALQIA